MAENADGNDVEDNIENVVNDTEIENDETYNDNNVNDDKNIENEDAKDGTTEENNNIDIEKTNEDDEIQNQDDDEKIIEIQEEEADGKQDDNNNNNNNNTDSTEPPNSSPPIDSAMLLDDDEDENEVEIENNLEQEENKDEPRDNDGNVIDNNKEDDGDDTNKNIVPENEADVADKNETMEEEVKDTVVESNVENHTVEKDNNQIPTPVDDVFENFQEEESAMIEINGGEGEEEEDIENKEQVINVIDADKNTKKMEIVENIDFDSMLDGQMENNNETELQDNVASDLNPHSTDGYVETPRELLALQSAAEEKKNQLQPNPVAMPIQSMEQMIKARELDEIARLEEIKKRNEIKLLKEQQRKAALKIQSTARGKLARKQVNNIRIMKNNAATKIQQYGRKFHAKKKVANRRTKIEIEKQREELLIMEENERIAKENALKEMENYNKIQDDLLKAKQLEEEKELESITNADEDEEEFNELTPSEIQSVQNMELNNENNSNKTQLDVALNYLRGNTVEAQRLLVEEEEERLARQREEEEALELERQRQLEIEDYISLDPVANHAKIIAEDGMNESMLHGASPPARTPQRLVSNSPVYRKERWQNAAAVLIQSVWRGTHFRRVNKLLLVAIKKLYDKAMRENELVEMHQNEMETQIREFKGIELVLAMEQRKCRRLEGSLGEAQRQHEMHLIERAKGTFHGALNSTNRKTSIRLNVSPKKGEDVPFTVHAQHKARKQAEHDLVEAKGKIRRLNYTIKNLLSKLKSNAADNKKKADEEISSIRQKMLYHERRSQSEIARLTMIVDNMGKDPDLNMLHPPAVYTKKTMPPVSSAVQTVETLTNNTFTKIGWGTPSENMSTTTNTNITQGYNTPTMVVNNINTNSNRLTRASISLPNIHEQPNDVNNHLDRNNYGKPLFNLRNKNVNSARANSVYSNNSTNIDTIIMSPLLQRISSVGNVAASNSRNRNKSSNNSNDKRRNSSRRMSGGERRNNSSNPKSPGTNMISSARSSNVSGGGGGNVNVDPTTPSASALGVNYQPGTLSNSDLRRIYGV